MHPLSSLLFAAAPVEMMMMRLGLILRGACSLLLAAVCCMHACAVFVSCVITHYYACTLHILRRWVPRKQRKGDLEREGGGRERERIERGKRMNEKGN